ncbi:MAG: hypothetical protein ABI051_02325 [Vicinamibacterales bacterium]
MVNVRAWRSPLVVGLLLAAAAAGCSKNPAAPTPVLTTETFTGSLQVLGSSSKNFTVNYSLSASDASVTVTSLTTSANSTPITTTIGIGFGVPAFDGTCTRSATYSSSVAAINQELPALGVFGQGTYCVQIFDAGTLTQAANYTFVVKHY